MRCTHSIISLVLISLITLSEANNLGLGDQCQIIKSGKQGICKFLTQCQEAQDDLRFNAIRPTICGHKGYRQIVCCAKDIATTPPPDDDFSNLPIAVRKCKEYSRYVFTNISVLLLEINAAPIQKSTDRCGHVAIPLIVGGSPAAPREFPHSALLGYRTSTGGTAWDCGGSLVSTRYVLTAGHCLYSPLHLNDVSIVRLGELVLNSDTDNTENKVIDVPVERIIAHLNYSTLAKYNDIALLKLDRKVQLSPFVRPICLPTEPSYNPSKAIATGWGRTKVGSGSDALLKVVLESYSNEECKGIFKYRRERRLRKGIIETQLCAGWRNESRDTCQGDSGGPLQIYNTDPGIYCMYKQVGITSYGTGCGSINYPGVYTRLYNYVEWIQDTIWAPGEDD